MKKKIILVDNSESSLTVGKNILSHDYEVFSAASGERLFKLLEHVIPDLILLDVDMAGMSGFQTMDHLSELSHTKDIPVIFLTEVSDSSSELDGLSRGAADYITKPFSPPLLLKRIEMHLLVQEQRKELRGFNENLRSMIDQKAQTVLELQTAIIRGVAEIVESRDTVTGYHIEHTQEYLGILLRGLQTSGIYSKELAKWENEFFLPSAQLHDVGKIAISDAVLKKPGKLTSEEFEEVKKHTTQGVRIIQHIAKRTKEVGFLKCAEIFAGTHHERWDGKGYPKGTAEEQTPLPGRILAIVDVYDALVSDRPYKKAFLHEEAVEIIAEGKETQFDPKLVEVFLATEKRFAELAR